MGESALHRAMKERVSRELAGEGYEVFFEPPFSPSAFLRWTAYRPDLLGIGASEGRQEYAIVECETRPSSRRLASKNFNTVEVQAKLDEELLLRRIVVVPRGRLAGLEPSVRLSWETWIYEGSGFQRFPRVCGLGESPSR